MNDPPKAETPDESPVLADFAPTPVVGLDEIAKIAVRAEVSVAETVERLDPITAEDVADRQRDRDLRTRVSRAWFIAIVAQLSIMNALFLCVGLDWLRYDNWLFHAYLVGTLGECFGVVLVITRNLFPRRDLH